MFYNSKSSFSYIVSSIEITIILYIGKQKVYFKKRKNTMIVNRIIFKHVKYSFVCALIVLSHKIHLDSQALEEDLYFIKHTKPSILMLDFEFKTFYNT